MIGDTVNTSARIAELTEPWPDSIVVSRSLYEQVRSRVRVEELDTQTLRGRPGKMQLYRLLGRAEDS